MQRWRGIQEISTAWGIYYFLNCVPEFYHSFSLPMHLYSIWEIFHNLKNWWNQLAWFGRNYLFTTISFVFLSIQLTSIFQPALCCPGTHFGPGTVYRAIFATSRPVPQRLPCTHHTVCFMHLSPDAAGPVQNSVAWVDNRDTATEPLLLSCTKQCWKPLRFGDCHSS